MERKKTILDLCSGLGGATEAFVRLAPPGYEVIRVDHDEKFREIPHTRIRSVLDWMDWIGDLPPIEAVWASPPCTEFSLAANAHRERPTDPDMRVTNACLEIIKHLKPRVWTLENVRGACRYFRPDLGQHAQSIGPYFLWGQFPELAVRFDEVEHHKLEYRDSARRSLIPWQISRAWMKSITDQQTLGDFV